MAPPTPPTPPNAEELAMLDAWRTVLAAERLATAAELSARQAHADAEAKRRVLADARADFQRRFGGAVS